jgi:L-alanine-DL-glutamate epimerase-like enolase superfamily enzyme
MAKDANLPLYRLLGGTENSVITDKTISIDRSDTMVQEAITLVGQGFTHIKLKLGLDPVTDLEVVKLIRREVGSDIHIKVDANQGWNVKQALTMIEALAGMGVASVEQPVAEWDVEGLSFVRNNAAIPVMADESCFSPQDALRLARRNAVDMINIKLMKSGGLYPSVQIDTIAQTAGISCMLGCMVESRLATAANIALVAARNNIIYADLDSTMFLREHPGIRGGYRREDAVFYLTDKPGLGIDVDF